MYLLTYIYFICIRCTSFQLSSNGNGKLVNELDDMKPKVSFLFLMFLFNGSLKKNELNITLLIIVIQIDVKKNKHIIKSYIIYIFKIKQIHKY